VAGGLGSMKNVGSSKKEKVRGNAGLNGKSGDDGQV